MNNYEHIFFDLDRTLWDFDANSHEALCEIFDECSLTERGIGHSDLFIGQYKEINKTLWNQYRDQQISQKDLRWKRFELSLRNFGIEDPTLAQRMDELYISLSPLKTNLLPGAIDVLDHLASRYRLHIITNGFEDVQHLKLQNSGLSPYFDVVLTSDGAGFKKPGREIFQLACQHCGADTEKSIMVGDDLETDIAGAQGVGMDSVYLNHSGEPHQYRVTHEIRQLQELKQIL